MTITGTERTRQPLYRHIQRQLQGRIARGEWVDGQALPNRRALCAEFNTTRVTLDKAIDGLVRDGWLRSAVGSGTYVSSGAPVSGQTTAAPAESRLRQISVILGRYLPPEMEEMHSEQAWIEAEDVFFGPLFQGIREGLSGKPVHVTYAHVDDGDYLDYCRRLSPDGVIVIAPKLADLPALRQLASAPFPFVTVALSSWATAADRTLPCVDTDNEFAAAAAVEHLLQLGHRDIAFVNLALSHANHQDRMQGYLRALATAGVALNPAYLVTALHYDNLQFGAQLDAWLVGIKDRGRMPTAIIAGDYAMSLATLQSLRRHGLRVPEDVSLVGFDDPLSAAHLAPPLTTVRQPIYQMGRRAARRLLDHLQEAPASPLAGTEILTNALIVRASTCPPMKHNSERTVEL